MSRGVHAFWFPPLFLDARLLWALSLFKDWVYFGCLSLSFSFFSSVSIIQFATISMVRVVMDIFINQNASKLFIDFLLCVLLKSGTRGFFVLARVCSYCAGVNIRWDFLPTEDHQLEAVCFNIFNTFFDRQL